ncbi:hypothetical protein PoB_005022100 [Plakobranchus ocellatus]|uniref:Reverse transcriptase RNase H-like domain-containing protein n=1 Tax=Plakobranchus ocellatus TaxID=259542 RepID=A0AAV4BX84_9GAST|nr:hypothetical protein PoB_005022100 [Plakobranchus ocellatus]
MHYQGPSHTQSVASNNYVCKISDNLRTYHANLLKRYTPRTPPAPHDRILQQACLGFVDEECMGEDDPALGSYQIEQKEFYTDVTIKNKLNHTQPKQAKDLLTKFSGALKAYDREHQIRLTDHKPSIVKWHFGFQRIMGRTFGTRRKNTRDAAESKFHDQTFQNNCGRLLGHIVSDQAITPKHRKS